MQRLSRSRNPFLQASGEQIWDQSGMPVNTSWKFETHRAQVQFLPSMRQELPSADRERNPRSVTVGSSQVGRRPEASRRGRVK